MGHASSIRISRLLKDFAITERLKLQFRAEFSMLSINVNFGQPQNYLGSLAPRDRSRPRTVRESYNSLSNLHSEASGSRQVAHKSFPEALQLTGRLFFQNLQSDKAGDVRSSP